MIPARSGTLTLTDGEHTITAPLAGAEVEIPPRTFKAGDTISLSFSAVVTYSAIGVDWGSKPTPVYTVVTTCARTPPPIGGLRAWARETLRTPWRRRSIASWRSAWRKVHGLTTITVEDMELGEDVGRVKVVAS